MVHVGMLFTNIRKSSSTPMFWEEIMTLDLLVGGAMM